MHKILIAQDISEKGKQYLQERGYEIKMGSGISVEVLAREVVDCSAIVARTAEYPREVLQAGKDLKVVGRHGVGVDNIDVEAATELGIYVTNAPESNAETVAEHTIALMLALAKNIVRSDQALRSGNFAIRNQICGVDVAGKTLGIVGLGRIGASVAKKAACGFEMKVIGYDPYLTPDNYPEHAEVLSEWDRIFRESDFVTLHLPSNEATQGIVGRKELYLMQPTACLINAARGEIVNEQALLAALREHRIAGAGLDVYAQEPPVAEDPLFALDNVVVTPHSAALTAECLDRMAVHAAMGIDEVLSGQQPSWPVNEPKARRQD